MLGQLPLGRRNYTTLQSGIAICHVLDLRPLAVVWHPRLVNQPRSGRLVRGLEDLETSNRWPLSDMRHYRGRILCSMRIEDTHRAHHCSDNILTSMFLVQRHSVEEGMVIRTCVYQRNHESQLRDRAPVGNGPADLL